MLPLRCINRTFSFVFLGVLRMPPRLIEVVVFITNVEVNIEIFDVLKRRVVKLLEGLEAFVVEVIREVIEVKSLKV